MKEDIKSKLDEFHKCNEEARKHFRAHLLKPGEPLHVHTEKDMMLYVKWQTKADIALNEFHAIVATLNPGKLPWDLEFLQRENKELKDKLERTEQWLTIH